jgi:predicted neutral ceramidase superfamily lipid hydrolase
MRIPKSYWYYWYTGSKTLAVISMVLTALLVDMGMFIAAGLSLWGVAIAVLLDSIGFWLAVIYALALRNYLPDMLRADADTLVVSQFVIPLLATFVIGRLVTWSVAAVYRGWKGAGKP